MRVPKCRSAQCQTRLKTEPRPLALIWRVDLAEVSHCGGGAQANRNQRRLLSRAPAALRPSAVQELRVRNHFQRACHFHNWQGMISGKPPTRPPKLSRAKYGK